MTSLPGVPTIVSLPPVPRMVAGRPLHVVGVGSVVEVVVVGLVVVVVVLVDVVVLDVVVELELELLDELVVATPHSDLPQYRSPTAVGPSIRRCPAYTVMDPS